MTLAEREEISRGLAAGESFRSIWRRPGRSASTISREIARNKVVAHYRAIDADDRACRKARRPQKCEPSRNPVSRGYVAARIREDWSPEQITGTLRKRHPAGSRMRVSHEAIYQSLFVQSRGVLAEVLQKHLRSGRAIRRSVHNNVTGQWRSQIKDAVSISERQAEIEDRAIPGHWEGDLLLGRHWTQIDTVAERATRFTVQPQVDGRDMDSVTAGLSRQMNLLPEQLRRSLRWDRGMELADHKTVTKNTGLDVYFADPRSPWQRGTNENTNRLLRQHFPKGVSLKDLSQTDLNAVAARLISRARRALDFDTPADKLKALLH